jgi:demethylspheroidene O-methyltransferase
MSLVEVPKRPLAAAAAPPGTTQIRMPQEPAASRSTFNDRLLAWRDRVLASPRFQRAAARFPATRFVSRRRARELFDLVAGFTYSQVLLACVRLELFDLLLDRPRTLEELALHAGLDDDAIGRLIAAAISLRLVEARRGGRFGLGALGAPLAGNRAIAAMVEHHAVLYADLADPVALLRRRSSAARATDLNAVWGYAANEAARELEDRDVASYSALMTASQPLVADLILDAYPMANHRRLLDIGGGEGAFAIAAARRHAHLGLQVFDLPAVAARATKRVASEGLADRIVAVGGDFVEDRLPAGADVMTLVRVIHDHDDARALRILCNARAALTEGGVLLVAEPMSGTPGAEPMGDAYFGMYLLAMGSGRPRTAGRLCTMLQEAGFRRTRLLRTALPLQTRVLAATR